LEKNETPYVKVESRIKSTDCEDKNLKMQTTLFEEVKENEMNSIKNELFDILRYPVEKRSPIDVLVFFSKMQQKLKNKIQT